jgi:autotransporter-associated beta strand protein
MTRNAFWGLIFCLNGISSEAATLFWDPNGAGGCGGTNNWGSGALQGNFWCTSCDVGLAPWNNANLDNATFTVGASQATLTNAVTVNRVTFTVGGPVIAGTSALSFSGTTPTIDAQQSSLTATILCPYIAGSLRKIGPGRVDLNNSSATVAVGKFIVEAGFFGFAADSRWGTAPPALVPDFITLNGGGIANIGVNTFLNVNRGITVGANGAFFGGAGLTTTNFAPITGTGTVSFATGAPFYSPANSASCIWMLSNPANNWVGGTTVSGNTLRLGASEVIPDGSTVTVSSGTLDLFGFNETVGTLVLAGGSVSGSGSLAAGSYDFRNGSCSAILGGATTVATKTTAGSLDLTAANTFSGGFQVNAGTVRANNVTALGAAGSTVTLGNGTTLSTTAGTGRTLTYAWTVNGNIVLGQSSGGVGALTLAGTMDLSGGARTISLSNIADTISALISNGGLTKLGTGTLTLSGNNTYAGDTTLAEGAITIGGTVATPFGNGAGGLFLAGGNLILAGDRGTTGNNLQNPLVMTADTEFLSNGTTGARNLVFGGPITTTAGTLTLHHNGGAGTGTLDVRLTNSFTFSRPITFVVDNTGNAAQLSVWNTLSIGDQVYSGLISGPGSIRRSATTGNSGGRAVFTAANTYSGGTSLNDGEIALGISCTGPAGAPTSGPIGTGTLTIGNNNAPRISGFGGSRTLGNNLTFSYNGMLPQTTLVLAGSEVLELAGGVNLGPQSRIFEVNNTALSTISGVITGTEAGITKTGTGTLALTASNTFGGAMIISAGTLLLAGSGGLANCTNITVASGATLDVSSRVDGTFSLNPGQALTGGGLVVGGVDVSLDAILAPGASPGTLVTGSEDWAGGGVYVWEINDGAGVSGSDPGWDLLAINGGLNLTANSGNKFTLKVVSLSTNLPGPATNFNNTLNSTWRLVTVSDAITNFDADAFAIDTTSFSNAAGGSFSIALDHGTNLMLSFTANQPSNQSPNIVAVASEIDGNISLTFAGIPGRTYLVQASTNLTPPIDWEMLTNNLDGGTNFVGGTNGLWTHTDLNATNFSTRFYRSVVP